MITTLKRGVALATATAIGLTLTAGTGHAASRMIDVYFHNAGAYTAEVAVFEGQFPNGGENNNRRINARSVTAGQDGYFRVYLDDVNGWTARGSAMLGRRSYFVFGQGSASKVCFRFDGTTIAGFEFNITDC
ncbi:hypothetical protein SAMN05421504_113146 [Amycolatopsis xylanica]|uniref:Uncharacterized protein n=1 Tax=Amycolatopsis xylanica TaxID=589385 RepID=A0A1H3SG54_9PSEU|nr:hypothetical protein [Amycolatopsis xylanica]SDZ36089.1 hypothetical protein SAMN05421504_113146 [Amycolatopsis xylanica]